MKWKIWLMHLDIMRVKMVYNVGKHSSRLSDELDMSLTVVQLLLNTLGGLETKTLEQKLKILEKRLGTYSKPPRY